MRRLVAFFKVAFADVVAAEVLVQLASAEHLSDGADDGVLDRTEGLLVAPAGPQALILRGEGDVFGANRCRRGLLPQSPVEVLVAQGTPGSPARRGRSHMSGGCVNFTSRMLLNALHALVQRPRLNACDFLRRCCTYRQTVRPR